MGDPRPTRRPVLALAAIVAAAACGGPSGAAPIPGERFVVASGSNDKYAPTAGGSIIIWQEIPPLGTPGQSADVLGYDVATGQHFVVGGGPGHEYPGGTDGRTIAWGDLGADGFYVRPAAGGPARHFRLALSPRVWGDLVAYGAGPGDTMHIELASLSGAPVTQPPDRPGRQSFHDISDRYLVWEDDPGTPTGRSIQAFDLRDGRTVPVRAGGQFPTSPAVSGGWVVWTESQAVWARNLDGGGEAFRVSSATASASFPDVSGSIAVWTEVLPGRSDGDVFGMDLLTGTRFPVATDVGVAQGAATISNSLVAWVQREPGGESAIYAVVIPEPGAAGAGLLAAAALLRRRRAARGGGRC